MKKVWDFLTSMKTAIYLFIIILILATPGIFIPQKAPFDLYLDRYGNFFGKFFIFLGFDDVYNTWWFTLLLLFLCIIILFCTLSRTKEYFLKTFKPDFSGDVDSIKRHFVNENFVLKGSSETKEKVKETIKKAGFRLRKSKNNSYLFEKGFLSYLGLWILHLSFVIIITGAYYKGQAGVKHHQNGIAGDTIYIPEKIFENPADKGITFTIRDYIKKMFGYEIKEKTPYNMLIFSDWREKIGKPYFMIRIDSLREVHGFDERTQRTFVKDWFTWVSVIDSNKVIKNFTIEVNKPLVYKDIYFYQSTFAPETEKVKSITLLIFKENKSDSISVDSIYIPFEREVFIPGTNYKVKIKKFIPDFMLSEDFEVMTRSFELRNPAVRVSLTDTANGDVFESWLFLLFPDFHGSAKFPLKLQFIDFEPIWITGLEISYHSGMNVIWTGFSLLTLGLILTLYLTHRRISLLFIEKNKDEVEIFIGGYSEKFREKFKSEFAEIVKSLKNIGKKTD